MSHAFFLYSTYDPLFSMRFFVCIYVYVNVTYEYLLNKNLFNNSRIKYEYSIYGKNIYIYCTKKKREKLLISLMLIFHMTKNDIKCLR